MRNNGYRKGRFHKGNASRLGKLGVAARAKERALARVPCAACDRGDFQLGHADGCKSNDKHSNQGSEI